MDRKKFFHLIGETRFYDRSRHIPKMNFHPSDRGSRMVWCGCMKNMRLNGKIYFCPNFWQTKKDGSGRGMGKYRIRPIWR